MASFNNAHIKGESLAIFFKHAPNLETFCFLHGEFDLEGHVLPEMNHLKTISINYVSVNNTNLTGLLKSAPNIDKLIFVHCKDIGISNHCASVEMLSLSSLYFDESLVSEGNLSNFLNSAPNIEELHIRDCTEIGISNGLHYLPNLKIIEIKNTNISMKDLDTLLDRAHNVEELILPYNIEQTFLKQIWV